MTGAVADDDHVYHALDHLLTALGDHLVHAALTPGPHCRSCSKLSKLQELVEARRVFRDATAARDGSRSPESRRGETARGQRP